MKLNSPFRFFTVQDCFFYSWLQTFNGLLLSLSQSSSLDFSEGRSSGLGSSHASRSSTPLRPSSSTLRSRARSPFAVSRQVSHRGYFVNLVTALCMRELVQCELEIVHIYVRKAYNWDWWRKFYWSCNQSQKNSMNRVYLNLFGAMDHLFLLLVLLFRWTSNV